MHLFPLLTGTKGQGKAILPNSYFIKSYFDWKGKSFSKKSE